MEVKRFLVMAVQDMSNTRLDGLPDPQKASVVNPEKTNEGGLIAFKAMLSELQKKGIAPGTRLEVTIKSL